MKPLDPVTKIRSSKETMYSEFMRRLRLLIGLRMAINSRLKLEIYERYGVSCSKQAEQDHQRRIGRNAHGNCARWEFLRPVAILVHKQVRKEYRGQRQEDIRRDPPDTIMPPEQHTAQVGARIGQRL